MLLLALYLISGLLIGFLWSWVDAHARDDEAYRAFEATLEALGDYEEAEYLSASVTNPFTRYHTGHGWDVWHIVRRIEVYFTMLSGSVLSHCAESWAIVAMGLAMMAIGGWIGFNAFDRWKGSVWIK